MSDEPHLDPGHTALNGEVPLADDVALAGAAAVVVPAREALTPLLTYAEARDWGVIVSDEDVDGAVPLVLREGTDATVLLELRRRFARPLSTRRATATEFEKLLTGVYGDTGALEADGLGFEASDDALGLGLPSAEDLLDSADDAPAIRLINGLIAQGLREGASDIHIEPYEQALVVRFREDGVLKEKLRMPPHVAPVLVSRIKVMARLDIAERRVPQDGRIGLSLGGKLVDVRVSTLPNRAGERVVMRLLDKDNAGIDLAQLGLDDHAERVLTRALNEPNGIVLVTGPTGSGKTTTLYAGLRTLNDGQRNILTVEDPVEYAVDGVGQTQVNAKVGLSFAAGLRAILRQDPDVVMVGEIRDKETADIAVQASLTGHLVLSTVHTNDSVGAITRMRDMGVEPFLLASTLRAVIAQRLVRRLCKVCRREGEIDPALGEILNIKPGKTVFHAVGCDACGHSGYQGRIGLFEALRVDDTVRRLVNAGASEEEIADHVFGKDAAGNRRGTRLVRAAKRLVLSGETSPEEAARVARRDDGGVVV
ncbi:GspE/PulE family protein [Croceicoccus naphthovorans]|uniref:General secretion pathway protein E n=1 Tax=Croceicoccus naphthovorans TaxID=1348774 RepID=A0A0G3XJX1_9SPHN|nr:ATPase, T2SS/T4P/T4SS family [Croceicoccus naphthovorans]AKM10663.1 general secretion pathway protein GspE [Croceicoccus naphthovorans]MBB3988898.1 general secretion pathway protein E [Croceicoccus naphthovorans]